MCQTPLHGYRLRTCCTTPPTDKLTTIYNCTTNLPHRNARAQHLNMSRCWAVANFLSAGGEFVVQQVVELLWARPLVHVRSRCPCSGVWHYQVKLRRRRIEGLSVGSGSAASWSYRVELGRDADMKLYSRRLSTLDSIRLVHPGQIVTFQIKWVATGRLREAASAAEVESETSSRGGRTQNCTKQLRRKKC